MSILPLLSEVFEKCIYKKLVSFLDKYKILNPSQFSSQQIKNTCDVIVEFFEKVYCNLNVKKNIYVILIDLNKAFDSVSQDILLRKIQRYGIRRLP